MVTRTFVRWGGGGGKTLLLTLALLALIAAAFAAIIAADFSTAQAQNDDETAGRIVARLLDDGRVEFGWQPSGGERVLPRQRYFPADATVDRWLRSSPVEVGGAEIGRINARLLEDGRIEFAFTPTDGERIAPQARYFPAGARVGRWLRSTEIAIGPVAPRYIAVSAGAQHTCAIRSDGAIECWGRNANGETDAPEGAFSALSAGSEHTCAIRTSGEIACWGHPIFGQTEAPTGRYTAISGSDSSHCAIRESSGAIECWGWGLLSYYGQIEAPDDSFTVVAVGQNHACAIRESSAIKCWGDNDEGQADAPDGSYTAASAGQRYTCAIRTNGEIACWGTNYWRQIDAPEGSFTAVATGLFGHICAIREIDSTIQCWGDNQIWVDNDPETGERVYEQSGQATPPAGRYTAVTAGHSHTCAIRERDGAIECWGDNRAGQTDVPTE